MSRQRGPVVVAAGVIIRAGDVLLGQRRRTDRHPFKWEFPGGKVESGETPQQALVRELREELGIQAIVGTEIARYTYDYPNGASVHLLFYAVVSYEGEPAARVFEQIDWRPIQTLPSVDFLEGDFDFVRRLAGGEFAALIEQSSAKST
jgi:8-oxo-dGTP diphosphatase